MSKKRNRYSPPYRVRRRAGLMQELDAAVKPSMAAAAARPAPVDRSPSSMTEDEASHLYNPELPGDGRMAWVVVGFMLAVVAGVLFYLFT